MRDDVKVVFSAADEFSATLNKFKSEMSSAASEAERHWSAVQGAWLKVAGAIATAAYAAGKAWEVAGIAAQFEEQKIALDGLARQYGSSAAVMINSIQRAAEGTIAQVDAIGVANKALIMGLNPQQLEFFTMAAKRLSGAIGGDTAQAFERLTEAVATGQQRQLKSLGIIVDLEAEYKKYGHELDTAEKQTANFEIVSRALNETFARMGPDVDTAADKMERLTARMKDLKKGMGDIVLSAAGAVYDIFYPSGLESALRQAEADSSNLYKNLDELKRKAKEIAAGGLSISAVTEEDVYRSRDWLTINLQYMEHLKKEEEGFRQRLLSAPISAFWLPSDEEIDRKTKAMFDMKSTAFQEYMSTTNRQSEFSQKENPYDTFTHGTVAQSSSMAAEYFQYQQRIQALQQYQQQEMDLLLAHNTAKLMLADTEEERNRVMTENVMAYKEMEVNHSMVMDRMKLQAGVAALGQSLAATGSMMMQGSKEQFEIGKKLALAGAVVSGAQAITNALATPPFPLGLALAALAAAQTMMQIQTIQNTKFMGGATSFSGAGGVGSMPQPAFSGGGTPTNLTGPEEKATTQNISLTVYTLDPSSVRWGKIVEDNIGPALERASGRNVVFGIKTIQQ